MIKKNINVALLLRDRGADINIADEVKQARW
jgi:hypothetical protein